MADYEIKKGVFGHKVLYNCPACGTPLTSSLDKSGSNDACPDCNRPHVVPGAAEKSEFERATAAKQRQKLDEEKRRAAAQAAAKNAPKPVFAPVANAASQNNQKPSVPVKPVDRRRTKFGDGILDGAFVVARISSIVVIVIGVIGIVIIALQFASAYSDYRTEQPATLRIPSEAEYQALLSQIPEPDTPSRIAHDDPVSPARASTADPLVALFKKYKLSEDSVAGRYLLTQIERLSGKLRSFEYEDFIRNLDKFLVNQKDKMKAAQWFCREYVYTVGERDSETESNKIHNVIRSGRMWSLTCVAGGLFGGLIGFLVLPLLIRIEANTRFSNPSQTPKL